MTFSEPLRKALYPEIFLLFLYGFFHIFGCLGFLTYKFLSGQMKVNVICQFSPGYEIKLDRAVLSPIFTRTNSVVGRDVFDTLVTLVQSKLEKNEKNLIFITTSG
jgi:hypothetical protein